MYVQRAPEEFALWNHYAMLSVVLKNRDELVRSLINCIRAVFVGLDDVGMLVSG